MCATASVGVNNNLAASETGVAVRAANHKLAGGVDEQNELVVEERAHRFGEVGEQRGQQHRLHVGVDAVVHSLIGLLLRYALALGVDKLVVLGADHDGVHTHGLVRFAVVFHRHLTLGVGAEVGNHMPLAELRQLDEQQVRQVECERQVARGLGAGVAKHHALVAGALVLLLAAVHAAVDVARLLVYGGEHAAGVGVEHVGALVVANLLDGATSHVGEVDIRLRLHFACEHHLSGGDEGFARHLRLWVESEKLVENSIANLIGNLVGVPFGNGFRCE